jgi:TonB family protein
MQNDLRRRVHSDGSCHPLYARDSITFLTGTLDNPSLVSRLTDEIGRAVKEVRRNPTAFFTAAFRGETLVARQTDLLTFGFAMALCLYGIFFGAVLLLWTSGGETRHTSDEIVRWISPPALTLVSVKPPPADGDGGGGGGGGQRQTTPPSGGAYPRFAETVQIVAPTTRPQLNPPLLQVQDTVWVSPNLQPKRDELAVTGLPDAPLAPPSDGPGDDGGIGPGEGGGIGPDKGRGVGPGVDRGIGGGVYRPGGRGREDVTVGPVDSRPVPINRPRPNYTEEARTNKIEGTVHARALVGTDGLVKKVVILHGLGSGLNDEATRAAYQMRFIPATKDGRKVSVWIPLDIEFNIR